MDESRVSQTQATTPEGKPSKNLPYICQKLRDNEIPLTVYLCIPLALPSSFLDPQMPSPPCPSGADFIDKYNKKFFLLY